MPAYSQYLIAGALIGVFLALKLNLVPKISAHLPARSFLIAILCGFALLNMHVYHGVVRDRPEKFLRSAPDEDNFQELRSALAAERYVGFITDQPRSASTDSLMRHFHTQYALAPILLVEGTSPNLIIGNFARFEPESVPDDLVLVRVFGPGLMLFRKSVQ